MEKYLQEIGRAGRLGQQSKAIMFVNNRPDEKCSLNEIRNNYKK
jgi:superfamily II DNA helicase RecQ